MTPDGFRRFREVAGALHGGFGVPDELKGASWDQTGLNVSLVRFFGRYKRFQGLLWVL